MLTQNTQDDSLKNTYQVVCFSYNGIRNCDPKMYKIGEPFVVPNLTGIKKALIVI